MSKIRIFSKKAFALGPGAAPNSTIIDSVITVPGSFQDIDERFMNDRTFKLAVKAGDITVINTPVTIISGDFSDEPEKEAVKEEPVESNEEKISKFYEELKAMSREQVKELAKKYSAEFVDADKLSMNKRRVFEAFKLSFASSEN